MTGAELQIFINSQGWRHMEACRQIGITKATLRKYLDDKTGEVPRTVALACQWLAHEGFIRQLHELAETWSQDRP